MKPRSSTISVTDMFCGAGGSSQGARRLGLDVQLAMNHWKLAVETHNTNFPNTHHDVADLRTVHPARYWSTNVLMVSPECFPAGTLILTSRGMVSIEDVVVGDLVFTHTSRWMPVTATMRNVADTRIIKGQGNSAGLEITGGHPLYVRRQTGAWSKKMYRRVFHEPEWRSVDQMEAGGTYRWSTPVEVGGLPIPPVPDRPMPLDDPEFWWLVGRWLADGNLRLRSDQGGEITLSCGKHRADELESKLSHWQPSGNGRSGAGELRWRRRSVRTAVLFEAGHSALAKWLQDHFGKLAHGKTIPAWALSLDRAFRQALLDGYVSGDGYKCHRSTQVGTVSKALAVGTRLLAESLGYRVSLCRYDNNRASCIEGRDVNVRDMWVVRWENNRSQRSAFYEGGHAWSLIKEIENGRQGVEVYNLSVSEDESYVADGIVVHNCTNHSVAKGVKREIGQLSLFEAQKLDPAAVRSRATMWSVPEYAEHHNYDLIIAENVVDARKWRPFDSWLKSMISLGYEHEIVYLNSMFAHMRPLADPRPGHFVPQSRDRMYVVFWKRGNKRPDLDIRPLAHCQHCGKDVQSMQSWKKRQGESFWRWGRYGTQYVYRCPNCTNEVMPYYYAAANAIDWSIPAKRIGDRPQPLKERTLDRIRRGLEMFAGEHLVVNLGHGSHDGRSFPLMRTTMPTQTTAQTAALLMLPFTVETLFTDGERTPRGVDEVLTTQTTRQSTAVITPFLTSVNYYDDIVRGVDGPLPTQTTGDKMGVTVPPFMVVLRNGQDARALDEAMTTITTMGAHHGVVVPPFVLGYANGDGAPQVVDEPLRTFHTGNGQGVVLPPFITYLRGTNAPKTADEALDTIAANGNHHALVTPFTLSYYGDNANQRPVDRELGTVTTKHRHALVQPGSEISVDDCGFRMLEPHEIGVGMGFDSDYIVLGSKRDRVKQYGNAVTPSAEELLLERCVATLQ